MRSEITREDVVKSVLKCFDRSGIKFSTDDVAKDLKTSKRTIYNHFQSKDDMMRCAIDYVFDDIELQHKQIVASDKNWLDKLIEILLVYPSVINLNGVDLKNIERLNPQLYSLIIEHFSTKWELTFEVFERCKEEGLIKQIDQSVFRAIFLGIYEQSIENARHQDVLKECVRVVFEGLKV